MSHPGGHYTDGVEVFLNSWTLNNGEIIKGNFSRADTFNLYLENEQGSFLFPYILLLNKISNW